MMKKGELGQLYRSKLKTLAPGLSRCQVGDAKGQDHGEGEGLRGGEPVLRGF